MRLYHLLDNLRYLLQQASRLIRSGSLGNCGEWSWSSNALCKFSRSGPGIICSHNGADDGNAIQSFPGSLALIQNPLDVGQVDSANGYGSDIAAGFGDAVENSLNTRGANDVLCVSFSNFVRIVQQSYTRNLTYVGVANVVPIPR